MAHIYVVYHSTASPVLFYQSGGGSILLYLRRQQFVNRIPETFFVAFATDATGVKFMSCVCCKIWEDVLIFQKAMLRSGKHMFAPLSFMPEQ